MRHYGRGGVTHGGTYTAQCMSLAAAEKTLTILKGTPALDDVRRYGEALQAGMSRILSARLRSQAQRKKASTDAGSRP